MTTILKTEALGDIRGKSDGIVSQFLGIQYATLKNRLADAELIEQRHGDILDATRDGPTALSPPIGCQLELRHVQQSLPSKDLSQSDVDCLNLNIAAPSNATPSSNLPVLFFIHGGGLFIGANSWPQFDLGRLVNLSVERDVPVVMVAINYRLGAPGFLTSEELRNAGFKANNGLRDQRVALQWVHRHIRDFGGNPDNITAAGMSAGGASVTYHLHSKDPLFKRAISMSGTSLLSKAITYEEHEKNYNDAMVALGLSNSSPAERVKAILEMPASELISRLPPSISPTPAVDSDIVIPGATYAEIGNSESTLIPGKAWCSDLLIGDAEADASIFEFLAPQMKVNSARNFISAARKVLESYPDEARRILDEYYITEETPDDEAIYSVLNFITDIIFHAPALTFALGWKGNAYVYHFNEGNPWDGPWKNRANHILDVAYLFQNFREYLSPEQTRVCTSFAEDFFKFCHGVPAWPAITPGDLSVGFSARVYGPSHQGEITRVTSKAFGEESRRRSVLFDCASKVSLDRLANVVAVFKSG
ncbi:hypothetical protein N7481_005091 [Penicillium waksmanii]|uniref:uncharacterized protein n=1 Tax=Penicillium waksmanii TaxID=69791 RepID=UPI0025494723|nr:uncharacterized protein N7481_005091 [Penicillium waksmanii]KAJ5982992.1 hypothetical protein N7481_005091 [Penicillium waksmanii]